MDIKERVARVYMTGAVGVTGILAILGAVYVTHNPECLWTLILLMWIVSSILPDSGSN